MIFRVCVLQLTVFVLQALATRFNTNDATWYRWIKIMPKFTPRNVRDGAMGTVRTRKRKYGTTYRAWIFVKGHRKSATFDKRSEAHAWIEEKEYYIRTGQPFSGELSQKIVHDRQSQFERFLAEMHQLFSCAEPGSHLFYLPFSKKISVRRVANSNFIIKKSQDSQGIQAIDLVLWLYERAINKKELTYNCKNLLLYIFRNGHKDDFSFEAAEEYLEGAIGVIESAPFGPKEQETAKAVMGNFEQNRQDKMLKYSKQKNGVVWTTSFWRLIMMSNYWCRQRD